MKCPHCNVPLTLELFYTSTLHSSFHIKAVEQTVKCKPLGSVTDASRTRVAEFNVDFVRCSNCRKNVDLCLDKFKELFKEQTLELAFTDLFMMEDALG